MIENMVESEKGKISIGVRNIPFHIVKTIIKRIIKMFVLLDAETCVFEGSNTNTIG